jgi:hypothetical protein
MRELILDLLARHRAKPVYLSRLDGHIWCCSCLQDSEALGLPVYANEEAAQVGAEEHVASALTAALSSRVVEAIAPVSPQRIQWNRFAGQPLPPNTKLITRPGRFGNPWKVADYPPGVALDRFEEYLRVRRNPPPGWDDVLTYPSDDHIRRALAGYDLACACEVGARCHGDALLRIARGDQP